MTDTSAVAHAQEIASGQRFAFGRNWARFLAVLDDDRIRKAEASLSRMLPAGLGGKTFLDAGSGSGLFSLAARRLGARVTSFDLDPQSVACTEELRRRYFPADPLWEIRRGSVLDEGFLGGLGRFDIVYSWGVLHHTGSMWSALRNVHGLVADGGFLYIALYNDEGRRSRLWRRVKRAYCSGFLGRAVVLGTFIPYAVARDGLADVLHGRNPARRYTEYRDLNRGMSVAHDWHDWLGGYPFEVARPGEVFEFFRAAGFVLERLVTTPFYGNNEFVLRKTGSVPS
jgi:2-polyprenyl-6-hydroxyphenyl methylase/3-demethylubiquinone-9 3-methyltransferase